METKTIGMVLDNFLISDYRVKKEAIFLAQNNFTLFILSYKRKLLEKIQIDEVPNIKVKSFYLPRVIVNKLKPFIGTPLDFYSIIWSFKIWRFVRKNNIKVLHVHDLYMGIAALKIARKLGLKIIIDLHENYPAALKTYGWSRSTILKYFNLPQKWRKLEHQILKEVDYVIVLSEYFKKSLLSKYNFLKEDQIFIYPNLPDVEELLSYPIKKEIFNKKETDFFLFYFGVVARRRGIFTLIEAMKYVNEENSNIKLLIIGPVDKADRKAFFKEISHLNGIIFYLPWADISDLPSYLYLVDVGVSPLIRNDQHNSGIANKVFQYLLFGKPVIVSDCIPQKDLIQKYKCGLVFESENTKDLKEKILFMFNSKADYKRFSDNARSLVLNEKNQKIYGRKLVRFYQMIFKSHLNFS